MSKQIGEKTTYRLNYEGEKCPLQTFHNRIGRGIPFEKAIVPTHFKKNDGLRRYWEEYQGADKAPRNSYFKAIQLGYPKEVAITKKLTIIEQYPEYYEYRKNYKGEKCSFSTFIGRIKLTNNLKQAIQPKNPQSIRSQTYNEAKIIIPQSYYEIEITYKPEEAKIFHKVYRNIIDDLEEEISQLADTKNLAKLEQKLQNLKQQYQVFLAFNPL